MARVFAPRSSATVRVVVNGDTLTTIAARSAVAGFTWQELALYNWGTVEPREVNRAIFERVGCTEAQINMANPENTAMTPYPGAQILIPNLFTATGLAVRKTHVVDVRPRFPAPAIRFDNIDKWFKPGDENCQFTYRTEGLSTRANQVKIEIRGSNYAKATPKKEGDFQTFDYEPLDIPLRVLQPGATQRAAQAATWDGLSDADEGTLAKRSGVQRPVNVAHSPYTVLARYWLDPSDAKARIDLEPFWLDFDNTGAQKPASRSIIFRVSDSGNKLKWGQVVVTDGAGAIVRRLPLRGVDLSDGRHAVNWDGNNSTGAQLTAANMPYRIQVEAHSDEDEDKGLALAAVHTEVRLWVHPNVGAAADPLNDPQCLEFQLAAAWCKANPPNAGTRTWYKYRLEQTGFHPGPVDDSNRDEYTAALKEFQRSHAVNLGANSYRRLPIDGKGGGETQTAVTNAPADERPLFGDLNNNQADVLRGAAGPTLNNPTGLPGLAVWIDDRHSYTTHDGTPSSIHMGDYRGEMDIGDKRVATDSESICRPWIPLQVRFGLLGRADPLNVPIGNALPAATANTHKSIGPLRVDWTFREPPSDHAAIVRPSGAPNAAQKTRSRAWIGAVTGAAGPLGLGKTWNGRDYINCPERLSGKTADSSFGPDQLATNPDANGDARNRFVFRVDGKKVTVTLTANANLPLATAVNEINNQLIAKNVAARALVDTDGHLVVRTNGFGTKRSIRVRKRNDPELLRLLNLVVGTQNGTTTAVAQVTGSAAVPGGVDTRKRGYLALRVNGTDFKIAIPAFENVTRADVATAIQRALPAAAANGTGVLLQTSAAGAAMRLVVSGDSDSALLTLLGLQADTYKGTDATVAPVAAAQPASCQATFAAAVNTVVACAHPANKLQLKVDGKPVDVELPELAAVTPAQILERVEMALKAAGAAAVASLVGGALHIETDGTGDREIKLSTDTSSGLKDQMGSESNKGSGPVVAGGERPDDLSQYFKRIVGNGKDDSLRPWLALAHERDDPAKNAIATVVHDDLGQDDDDFFVNQQGRAGIFFRPSRIAGDAYQLRAQVSFDAVPGAPLHPNWATLEKRYRRVPPAGAIPESKAPQAHTAIFRNWRKDSVRGYVGWNPAPNVGLLAGAQDIYRDAYLEMVHETGGALTQFPIPPAPLGGAIAGNSVMTPVDFTTCVRADLDKKGSYFRGDTPNYCPGYAWPYLKLAGYGFGPSDATAAAYASAVGTRVSNAWRTYRARVLQRLLQMVEEKHGLLRGHTLVEVSLGPQMTIREFLCTTAACGRHVSEIIDDPFAANGTNPGTLRADPPLCPDCNNATYTVVTSVNKSFSKIAVGINMGAAWLYDAGDSQTWAHEMGHHKHLQHAQGNQDNDDGAPGFSLAQHDSEPNPGRAAKVRWHRRGWDCFCVMGYDKEPPLRFCGKCLLKLRGWAVEGIKNPAGGVGGP